MRQRMPPLRQRMLPLFGSMCPFVGAAFYLIIATFCRFGKIVLIFDKLMAKNIRFIIEILS